MTAVAKWLRLWCMEARVAGSNPGHHVDLFFFSLENFSGRLVLLYVTVLVEQSFRYRCRYCRHGLILIVLMVRSSILICPVGIG